MSKLSHLPVEDKTIDFGFDRYPNLTEKFQTGIIIQATLTDYPETKLMVWNHIHYPSTQGISFTSSTVAVFTVRKKAS